MNEELERSEEDLLQPVESEDTVEAEPSEESNDEIPEKYQGKSTEELIQILKEKEKFQGRQTQEVGTLRKIVDNYIETQSAQLSQAPQEEESDDIDYFADPKTAIQRAVDKHPSVRQAEQVSQAYMRQTAQQALQSSHPDMLNILQDPAFAQWIEASPVRTELFVKADQQFNVDAANELLSNWKERKGYLTKTQEVEATARQQQSDAANVGGGRGSSETAGKPIYKRSDIVNMMVERPSEYQRRLPEIKQAYAENRVVS